jgi:hypothetical protein
VGKSTDILYPDLKDPSNFVSEQELHSEASGDEEEQANVIGEGEEGGDSMDILDPLELKTELKDDGKEPSNTEEKSQPVTDASTPSETPEGKEPIVGDSKENENEAAKPVDEANMENAGETDA